MSNTPRTDAAEVTMLRLDGDADVVVAAFFARQLERELIAARSATGATEKMADAVRGVLQVLRNTKGASFGQVLTHCALRGDSMIDWPTWIKESKGYVTEDDAARMIYEIMQVFAPKGTAAPVEEGATASGNPLLWNVHCMYQQGLRDEAWEMQWRQLLAAIEQHLQRVGYPNGGSDMKGQP